MLCTCLKEENVIATQVCSMKTLTRSGLPQPFYNHAPPLGTEEALLRQQSNRIPGSGLATVDTETWVGRIPWTDTWAKIRKHSESDKFGTWSFSSALTERNMVASASVDNLWEPWAELVLGRRLKELVVYRSSWATMSLEERVREQAEKVRKMKAEKVPKDQVRIILEEWLSW